jgi:hypothetical protein
MNKENKVAVRNYLNDAYTDYFGAKAALAQVREELKAPIAASGCEACDANANNHLEERQIQLVARRDRAAKRIELYLDDLTSRGGVDF